MAIIGLWLLGITTVIGICALYVYIDNIYICRPIVSNISQKTADLVIEREGKVCTLFCEVMQELEVAENPSGDRDLTYPTGKTNLKAGNLPEKLARKPKFACSSGGGRERTELALMQSEERRQRLVEMQFRKQEEQRILETKKTEVATFGKLREEIERQIRVWEEDYRHKIERREFADPIKAVEEDLRKMQYCLELTSKKYLELSNLLIEAEVWCFGIWYEEHKAWKAVKLTIEAKVSEVKEKVNYAQSRGRFIGMLRSFTSLLKDADKELEAIHEIPRVRGVNVGWVQGFSKDLTCLRKEILEMVCQIRDSVFSSHFIWQLESEFIRELEAKKHAFKKIMLKKGIRIEQDIVDDLRKHINIQESAARRAKVPFSLYNNVYIRSSARLSVISAELGLLERLRGYSVEDSIEILKRKRHKVKEVKTMIESADQELTRICRTYLVNEIVATNSERVLYNLMEIYKQDLEDFSILTLGYILRECKRALSELEERAEEAGLAYSHYSHAPFSRNYHREHNNRRQYQRSYQ